MNFKCGTVSVVGKPNVGKSSLINFLVGQKISIVSPKPQTTRNNILGIVNKENYQIVFVDTPGIHESRTGLDKQMMKSVRSATDGCDIVLCVIDGSKPITESSIKFVTEQVKKELPVIVAISKIDISTFEKLYPELAELQKVGNVKDFIPYSSVTGENCDKIEEAIVNLLSECKKEDALFENDMITDRSISFMCSEIVREKTLLLLNEEVPHGIAVQIVTFKEKSKQAEINATIVCDKESHKSIIIGKNGSMIKKIGTQARKDIEKLVGKNVVLELWVKVREGWKNDPSALAEIYKFEI
ncbi:MAG: GTPase Era [Clostridia bacterium]